MEYITYVVDETGQGNEHLAAYDDIENDHWVHLVIAITLLDVVEVEKADKEQESSVADRNYNKRDSPDVSHAPIKLEVAFPSEALMSPLDNPAGPKRLHLQQNNHMAHAHPTIATALLNDLGGYLSKMPTMIHTPT